MPIYDFACSECDKKFQLLLHIDEYDPKKVDCPKCGSKKVERVWSTVYVETSKKS